MDAGQARVGGQGDVQVGLAAEGERAGAGEGERLPGVRPGDDFQSEGRAGVCGVGHARTLRRCGLDNSTRAPACGRNAPPRQAFTACGFNRADVHPTR